MATSKLCNNPDVTALVVGSAPLDAPGGVEACCREVMGALEEAGFSAQYLSGREQVDRLGQHKGRKLWGSAAEVERIASALRLQPMPDLVVSNGPLGWGARGSHSVHYYHGTYPGQATAVKGKIRRRGYMKLRYLDGMTFERMAGRGKLCLANSYRTAREVERFYGYECKVVWCPVNIEKFTPGDRDEQLLSDLNLDTNRPVGVFIGLDRPMKGSTVALEVMRQTPDVQWVAIGGDRTYKGVPGIVTNRLPSCDMPGLYRSADFLLMTSVYEPFGLVVAEALSTGTPVVGAPTGAGDLLMADGALREYVVDDPLDVASFVGKVKDVLSDPLKAARAALEGRAEVVDRLGRDEWGRQFVRAVWS